MDQNLVELPREQTAENVNDPFWIWVMSNFWNKNPILHNVQKWSEWIIEWMNYWIN